MSRIVSITLAVLMGVVAAASTAHAAVRIEPAVLDIKALPREAPYFTVQVINDTGSRATYYPMVGEFDAVKGTVRTPGSPYEASVLVSANLEMNREEFSVAPGASVSLTGKLNISSKLPPGTYHAVIVLVSDFPEGGKDGIRPDPAAPRVFLNIDVQSDAKERLEIATFTPLKRISTSAPVKFVVRIENGGNVAVVPGIETKFFDRTDRERGSVTTSISEEGGIPAEQGKHVSIAWDGAGGGFGRYRALISVSYGEGVNSRVLTASTMFWVLPWWFVLGAAVLLIVVSYIAARVIVRSGRQHHVA